MKINNYDYILAENTKQQSNNRGSADRGELDTNIVVNQPASGKIFQSTTVSSQCERLYQPWTWRNLYFDW